jgi:hypothetical protein
MAPTVQGIYTGTITTAANPTVNFAGTPQTGDVLILTVMAGTDLEAVTAVSGCGATWTRLAVYASSYLKSFWIGTGATSGGTITTTGAAHANGKVVRVHHLRGVEPSVVGAEFSTTLKARATSNQIVIGYGYSTSSTAGASITQTTKVPGGAWTDQTELVYPVSNNRSNTTYLIPTAPVDAYVQGGFGVILVIGSPVPGTTVTDRALIFNSSVEASSISGWSATNATVNTSTDFAMFGTKSAKMVASAAAPFVYRNVSSTTGPYCVAGRTYTASAYVKSVIARNGRMNIRWGSASGSLSSTSNGTTTALAAGVWTRLTVTAVAPAGQYTMGPAVEITDGISGDITYVDGWKIEEGSSATAYFDGSVTTADRLNINMPNVSQYAIQTTVPAAAPTASVQGVFYGAVSTGANPTVNVTNTPATGDVLILAEIRGNTSQVDIPDATAVSGCGATWTKIGGGHTYQNFWIGTGATFSGTVTATASDPPIAAYSRHLRVHQLRGVSPDVYIQQYLSTYPVAATPNQVVLAGAFSQSSTIAPIASVEPSLAGWTTDTESMLISPDRRYNSAWIVPKYQETFNVVPGSGYTTMLVIGSPVAGMEVTRRNLVGNPSGETDTTDWSGSGTSSRTRTLTTAAVGAGSITSLYNANATAIIRKATGANGPQGPAVPGRTYTVSCWVRCNNARDAGVTMLWLDLSQGIMTTGTYNALTPLVANTWTRLSWTGVAPAGTRWVGPECKITGCLTGDQYWWDGFMIEEGTSVIGDYFDGSTTPPAGSLNYFVGASDFFQSLQLTPIPLDTGTVDFNRRESGAWVSHTAHSKVYKDGAWITRIPKYWDGSAWIDLP